MEQDNIVTPDKEIVSWVMTRVTDWQQHRDNQFKHDWETYYLMWRCKFNEKLRARTHERSKIVSPALMQAIDDAYDELVETLLSHDNLMELVDDVTDSNPEDVATIRYLLKEDIHEERVESALREVLLNGVIYGTGIGKIVVEQKIEKEINVDNGIPVTVPIERYVSRLIPVHPQEFVIDPVADNIEDALGMAHITVVPKHLVLNKMAQGSYRAMEIGAYGEGVVQPEKYKQPEELRDQGNEDKTLVIEYHGKLPKKLYDKWRDYDPEQEAAIGDLLVKETEQPNEPDIVLVDSYVEVIITIANGVHLLRVDENPMLMQDRAFVAFQYEKIPGRFWGRGVGEKGVNVARAIDAEMRARIDAMALSLTPMLGLNAMALPPGAPLPEVAPGKTLLFNGDPSVAVKELKLATVGPETFNQTAELQRMMQQATGTIDFTRQEGYANEKTGVVNAALGKPAKRANRVIISVEMDLIQPLVQKLAWRYIQYDPMRYPATDVKFVVKTRRSSIAREQQQQQYASLLSTIPADSPAYFILLKGLFENSTIPEREQIMAIIDQMMQQSLQQKQVEQIDPMFQLQLEKFKAEERRKDEELEIKRAQLQLEAAFKEEQLAIERDKIILDSKLEAANIEQDAMTSQMQLAMQYQQFEYQRVKDLQGMIEKVLKKVEERKEPVSKKIKLIEDELGNPIGGEVEEYDENGELIGKKRIDLANMMMTEDNE